MSVTPTTSLAEANAELHRRVEAAEATIARLVAESAERERRVRELVAELPRTVSRRALVKAMVFDSARRLRGRLRRSA